MAEPEIHMKWNDFEENIRVAFKDFRNVLNDVVLHCSNGKTYANRLVLCACSDIFKTMLMDSDVNQQQQFPSVLLWETEISLLNLIIDFMYCGEVKVTETGLPSFLALAERLKVKGLCRKGEDESSLTPSPPQPLTAASRSKQKRQKPAAAVLEEISGNEGRTAKKARTNPHAKHKNKTDDSAERNTVERNMVERNMVERNMVEVNLSDSENVVLGLKLEHEEVIDLEPEQELVEGQEDLYPDPSTLLESPSNHLLYPLDPSTPHMDPSTHLLDHSNHNMDSEGLQSSDQMMVPFQPLSNFGCDVEPDISNDQSQHPDFSITGLSDPNNPFVCNLCMKSYKSQGSLQNHRSIYHRDQIRTRRT